MSGSCKSDSFVELGVIEETKKYVGAIGVDLNDEFDVHCHPPILFHVLRNHRKQQQDRRSMTGTTGIGTVYPR